MVKVPLLQGATTSIIYGYIHGRGKSYHTYIGNKHEVEALKQRLDQQDKLIMKQSKQIQELIQMNQQRSGQNSPPEVTRSAPSFSSHDRLVSRRLSASFH